MFKGEAYDCTFDGNGVGNDSCGGAIFEGYANNCNFFDNYADNGGALYDSNAFNCLFDGNQADEDGGAMYGGTAILCHFEKDTINQTTIIPAIINVFNYTTTYHSGERLQCNITADGNVLHGFDTDIDIYKDGILVDSWIVGEEGWVIDLNPGVYTVVLSITNHWEEPSSNATVTVTKSASKITASSVTTTYNVGKNLVITLKDSTGKAIKNATLSVNLGGTKKYTTNSNGQVKINVATLVPKAYTAKITYAESVGYKGSTKSVKVTVKKANPKLTAKSASFKLKVKTKKYTAILKNNKNQVLKKSTVALKVNGKTYTVKTNNKGQAVFKITNLGKIGTYVGAVSSSANKYYNKVTKKVKIIVKQ